MTEKEYRTVWEETEKAIKYICKKNLPFVCNSVPSGYGVAHLLSYDVANFNQKAIDHVKKTYPLAMVNFTNDWVRV